MSWNRLVTKDISWLSSLCPCAGVAVVVEPLEPAAALLVVVAVTALVELAGVLTGTKEGAGPGELAEGLLGSVAGVAPAEPVAAPLTPLAAVAAIVWLLLLSPSWSWPIPPVRNWSTALAMAWN